MAYSAGVTSGSFRLEARELDHLVPLLVFEATGARLRSVPLHASKGQGRARGGVTFFRIVDGINRQERGLNAFKGPATGRSRDGARRGITLR